MRYFLALLLSLCVGSAAIAGGSSGPSIGGSGGTPANPTATAGPAANNGSATTYMRSDASPAVQKASNAQFGLGEGDGTTMTFVAGVGSTLFTNVNHAGSFSSWNIGGQDFMSVTGTATLPTLTIGQSFMLVTGSGVTATLTVPGGVTLAGAVSSSTLGPLSFLVCTYNSATEYDCATASNSSGTVSSVSNSDSTLTISPTTGAVVASLALGHANTWSGQQTFVAPVLGTPASGTLTNATGLPIGGLTGLGTGVPTALADAANATGGFGTVGTSGTNVGLLNANKTDSGNNTYSGATQTYSAIPSGTIASGKNIGLNSSNQLVTATVSGGSGGGGTFNYSDNGVTLSGTAYVPIGGGGAPSATEANVDVGAPSALTVANLQVGLSAAPGVGNSVQVTLRDNAASQAVTCTISGSSAISCSDLTHSFNVAQSDLIDWQIITTGTIVGTPTITITANNGTSNVGVTSVACGTGLSGGTITTTGTCAVANTAVTAGSYTNLNATINAQGQITAASNGSGGGGSVSLVSTLTASNSASLAWTGLTGNKYELKCSGIIWAASGNLVAVQFGEGATPTWKTSGYNESAYINTGGTLTNAGGTNHPGAGYLGGVAITGTQGMVFDMTLDDLASTTINKSYVLSGGWIDDSSALYHTMTYAGYYVTDTAAITAIRLIDTFGGNITSGSCSLYAYSS